ncbi:phosphoribosyltransferase family protein [Thalassomonas actiniarum]|uniref:Uncharacterized protein n=1 Tax=Thalassomonas actiniarum TaxID=485447 RepID=A0AAF0C5C8_9GAMM|nr:phosphoribosyltransferase family protein [Thalassomonas actiniarum]WDE00961.1 hypothetical protein SG35_010205 [Thalassomonas actiniarum]
MSQGKDNLHVLQEIQGLSLAADDPLYYHYPAMKLGQLAQVNFFSEQLSNKAIDILTRDREENGDKNTWLITAPAYYQLPAAANLLARKIHLLLKGLGFNTSLAELRLGSQQIEVRDQQEFSNYHNYSKNTVTQRIKERQRVQGLLACDDLAPQFSGSSVLVVNDINVTGTQQKFIQQTLNEFGVKESHWLYIFTLDKQLAKNNPEIEYQLNNLRISDLDSYIEVLKDSQTQHTARCIGRLFDQDIDNFRYLAGAVGSQTRAKLYQLAQSEARFSGNFFAEKMQILANQQQEINKETVTNTGL